MIIRPTVRADLQDLSDVVEGTGLFPPDMLPQLVSGFLADGERRDIWLTCEVEGRAVGFCYTAPETLTDGTWNMLAIGVLPALQGSGAGSALVASLEAELRARGQRVIIADTSGTPAFDRTRQFYRRNGYHEEARIRDFWAAGDDKVVFWKSLCDRA